VVDSPVWSAGGTDGVSRDWYLGLVSLAATLVLASIALLKIDAPYFAFGLLVVGCGLLIWVTWALTAQWRNVFRAMTLILALLISACVTYRVYPARKPNALQGKNLNPPKNEVLVVPTPPDNDHLHVEHRKQPVSQEVTLVMYNDLSEPHFLLDGKPVQATRYASGIATFRLLGGIHLVQAEYSTRICAGNRLRASPGVRTNGGELYAQKHGG
jgi:hypothetical protein